MYKIDELRKKTEKELLKLISELKGKIMALRFENATGQLSESHLIKTTKKDVAKIFTVLKEKQSKIINSNSKTKPLEVKKEAKKTVNINVENKDGKQ